jgi:hypothetical protein
VLSFHVHVADGESKIRNVLRMEITNTSANIESCSALAESLDTFPDVEHYRVNSAAGTCDFSGIENVSNNHMRIVWAAYDDTVLNNNNKHLEPLEADGKLDLAVRYAIVSSAESAWHAATAAKFTPDQTSAIARLVEAFNGDDHMVGRVQAACMAPCADWQGHVQSAYNLINPAGKLTLC